MIKNDILEKVMIPIKNAGFDVYFVGGCVRDEILQKEPNDFDIVTSALPKDIHNIFTKFSEISKNSEKFGVTIPLIDNGTELEEVEIASFRKDISQGRHPKVSLNASLKEDALRRDFTINALYENIHGVIIDPTGLGIDDIKSKTIRFVGNANDRLAEDPLRALRLVRFVSKLGFTFKEN